MNVIVCKAKSKPSELFAVVEQSSTLKGYKVKIASFSLFLGITLATPYRDKFIIVHPYLSYPGTLVPVSGKFPNA